MRGEGEIGDRAEMRDRDSGPKNFWKTRRWYYQRNGLLTSTSEKERLYPALVGQDQGNRSARRATTSIRAKESTDSTAERTEGEVKTLHTESERERRSACVRS